MSDIRYEAREGVATMTIDRPRAMNSIDPPMIDDMRRAIARAGADDDVRVLVIAGSERVFSAGADLKYLEQVLDDRARYFAFVHRLNELMFELEAAPLPTIAMVRGYALAGGLELMLACDLAIAATDARIGDQHANYGLMPGAGGTQRLPRRIGVQRAKELLFSGIWLSGTEAAAIGLVLRAVAPEALAEEVGALASRLASKSKKALGYTKRAVDRGLDLPLRHGVDEEGFALFEYFSSSPSPRAGLDAFLRSETPVFPE
jgi:enoyl-CoA hydratase/carnithine racemase